MRSFMKKLQKFALLKTTDDKYFTYEEYEKLIKENQTDKNKNLIYLYSTDKTDQLSPISTKQNQKVMMSYCWTGQLRYSSGKLS